MRINNAFLAFAAATLLITGCSQNRNAANDSLEKIEESLKDLRADAQRYAPDGLKGVESQLANLKTSFEAKEYGHVLAGTPQLEKAVGSLREAVVTGREHARRALAVAKTEWEGLNVEVPKMVESIEARVEELDKRKIRFRVSKEELATAKSDLEWMKNEWAEATADVEKGAQVEAAEKGKAIKAKGEEVRKQLGMKDA
jgi:hypothetical protein